MNVETLEKLKEEIHDIVIGSFMQGGTKAEIEKTIHILIDEEFEKIK